MLLACAIRHEGPPETPKAQTTSQCLHNGISKSCLSSKLQRKLSFEVSVQKRFGPKAEVTL